MRNIPIPANSQIKRRIKNQVDVLINELKELHVKYMKEGKDEITIPLEDFNRIMEELTEIWMTADQFIIV